MTTSGPRVWAARLVAVATGVVLALAAAAGAGAEAPAAVSEGLQATGVWVAPGLADPVPLEASVAEVRRTGVELSVVVAAAPEPDPDAFATRVRQLGGGDPVLVFGPTGALGVSSEALDRTDLARARDAAAAQATPAAATEAFAVALLSEPEKGLPALARLVVSVVVVAVTVLGLAVLLEQTVRYSRRSRALARAGATGRRPGPGRPPQSA